MNYFKYFLTFLSVFIAAPRTLTHVEAAKQRTSSVYLRSDQVQYLANLANETHFDEVLNNICVPRVVGTRTHSQVFDYITRSMSELGWDVDVDKFEENTPTHGVLTFRNVVATLNPDAEQFLVLGCHYDSKYFQDFDFYAATDSAVPCSMLINLAMVMKRELMQSMNKKDISLKLIFFDGEEAFLDWTSTDSLYGARHLATKYQRTKSVDKNGKTINELNKIKLFVLLDLLGAKNPSFFNYYEKTRSSYVRFVNIENKLDDMGLLNPRQSNYFKDRDYFNYGVEDDHIPFLRKGVPIIHVITVPFPDCWHKPSDTKDCTDPKTIQNLNTIVRVFVTEFLHLF